MWRFLLGKVSPQWKKRTLDSGRDGPEERLRTCVRRSSTADEAAGIISRELDPSSVQPTIRLYPSRASQIRWRA